MNNWWQKVFDEKYTFTHAGFRHTEVEVDFLKKILGGREKILDLACGDGRLSIPLAEAGYNVVGVDYSEYQINKARERATHSKADHSVEFVQGDMRFLNLKEKFDAVIIMFSSFGYFEDEDDHIKTLVQVEKALKPGGIFILDIINPPVQIKKIAENPTSQYTKDDGTIITQSNSYNSQTKRWQGTWSWKDGTYTTDMRIFELEEIDSMLGGIGMQREGVWGTYKMKKFDKETSPRIIIQSRKLK